MDVIHLNTAVVLTDSHSEKMQAETIVLIFFHIIIPFYLEAELEHNMYVSHCIK
jgi:hypothetical protein